VVRTLALAILFCLAPLASAHAQRTRCGPPEAMDDAAQLYECGTRALTAEDHAQAERYLACSLEREASVRTAFNLAIALRNLGQARRALSLLQDLERGRYGEVPSERRESLARQIETNLASLATVVVALPPELASARVELDGVEHQDLRDGSREARFFVEPGEHAVLASADGVCMERQVLSVSRGQTRMVALVARACPETAPPAADPRAPSGERDASGSDDGVWIGLGVGLGAAVVAGVIVLGVVLGSGANPPTCEGGVCIETLLDASPTSVVVRF
jgi:hypothetical protein